MAALLNGIAVSFGLPGTFTVGASTAAGGVETGAIFTGKLILQSSDFEHTADEEKVLDEVGNLVTRIWFNPGMKATLEWIPKGSSIANALTASNIATVVKGSFLNITAADAMPGLIAMWQIIDLKTPRANNVVAKVNFSLEYHAGITARAT